MKNVDVANVTIKMLTWMPDQKNYKKTELISHLGQKHKKPQNQPTTTQL